MHIREHKSIRPYYDFRAWRRNNSTLTVEGNEWPGVATKDYAVTKKGKADTLYTAPMELKTSKRGEKHYVRVT